MEDTIQFFYTPDLNSSHHTTITNAHFKAFHTIDRTLYARITCLLHRDPAESIQVMAFWLWLENSVDNSQLVHKIQSTFTDPMLHALIDEAVYILNIIESDEFPSIEDNTNFTRMVTGNNAHTLKYFHDNRLAVIRGVMKNVHEVCMRAFEDIFNEAMQKYNVKDENGNVNVDMHAGKNNEEMLRSFDPYDLEYQRKILNDNASDVLNSLKISPPHKKNVDVRNERTLFLTFSNGYTLSENEVRVFFTKKFGDCVEAIYMQNVGPEEQPKFARLVVKHPSTIEVVLNGNKRVLFIINGKQVYARKFTNIGPKGSSKSQTSSKPVSPML